MPNVIYSGVWRERERERESEREGESKREREREREIWVMAFLASIDLFPY